MLGEKRVNVVRTDTEGFAAVCDIYGVRGLTHNGQNL